jgi:hypothetical protein
MDYLQIGLFCAGVTLVSFPVLCFKHRWFSEDALEDLYKWWDGENTYSGAYTSISLLILITICAALLTILIWLVILPLYFGVRYFISVRNKRVALLREKAKEELYGKKHKH